MYMMLKKNPMSFHIAVTFFDEPTKDNKILLELYNCIITCSVYIDRAILYIMYNRQP